jgi:hypothetical protein
LSVLDKVRRWIDGETSELVLEQAARDAQVQPRSKAEEFIVKIAREVESVMQSEMVPLPQGTIIIPSEYTIFLSADDDKAWQGIKRKGLEQGLYHILSERAREIAGKKKLETRSFVLELRVDATLEKDQVRVQHSWEDSNANKTGVLKRPDVTVAGADGDNKRVSGNDSKPAPGSAIPIDAPPVFPALETARAAVPLSASESEELTAVISRRPELYKLEIWKGSVRQDVVPVFKSEISAGRGSRSKPVDVALPGDVEISRRHLTISTDGSGKFWVVNEGKNPALLNNAELPSGERVPWTPGVPLNVCSYMLRIQPL